MGCILQFAGTTVKRHFEKGIFGTDDCRSVTSTTASFEQSYSENSIITRASGNFEFPVNMELSMQSVVAPTLYFLDDVCAFAVANIPY